MLNQIFAESWRNKRIIDDIDLLAISLFNLINYINASKEKGLSDDEIDAKLEKAGWNSEQRDYALRKYAGKRTGMFEIPMDWLLNIFRKKTMPHYDKRIVGTVQPNLQYKRY